MKLYYIFTLLFVLNISSANLLANSLLDCCGLFTERNQKFVQPIEKRFSPSPQSQFGKKDAIGDSLSSPKKVGKLYDQQTVNGFTSAKSFNNTFQSFDKKSFDNSSNQSMFIQKKPSLYQPKINCPPKSSFVQSASVPTFAYAPRMKSVRVSTVPNIEGWERSLREEMRLKGRSRQTVNRLLMRIQEYYNDPTIAATDYSPGNLGYDPASRIKETSEASISRSVESLSEYFQKSDNLEIDSDISGNETFRGKLAFINTQLVKLGKDPVSMNELRDIIALKLDTFENTDQEDIAKSIKNLSLKNSRTKLAIRNKKDESESERKIENLYIEFATWLANNGKSFPSLDPSVDRLTMQFYDKVNNFLLNSGKFESMQIFREKTLAHLDEILDNRGQKLEFEKILPSEHDELRLEPEWDSLNQPTRFRSYSQLASLPGKVTSFNNDEGFTAKGKKNFDILGNRKNYRVMNKLPGNLAN